MGLLEKLKNTFFEEEYIEVEEKEKPIARKVELKSKKMEKKAEPVPVVKEEKEEKEETEIEVVAEKVPDILSYSDKEMLKKDNSIQYFEEEDFIEEVKPSTKEENVKLYGEDSKTLYEHLSIDQDIAHKPYTNVNSRAGFKPTPIISPIYGILDKNYRKEEVVDKKDKPSSYVSRKNADLDFVRNKAFGTLEDDVMFDSFSNQSNLVEDSSIENTNFEEDSEDIENSSNDSLLVDMTETDTLPAVNKVTIADAEEYFEDLGLEYNVDYKDSRYEKATGRRVSKNEKVEEENKEESVHEEEEEDTNLDDNLFDLIDSMYEEKE